MPKRGPGRPREKNVSKWAHWKRNQRATPSVGKCANCGRTMRLDTQHKDGNPANNSRSNRVRLCRSCHTAIDNRLGRHRKKR